MASINTDFLGNPYVTLKGGVNMFSNPQFSFGKDHTNEVAKLRKGMQLTLICEGRGDVAKTPMSEKCEIVE